MKNICLCNDSFPPYLDGVANVVQNYAKTLTDLGENAFVLTPKYPNADDSKYKYQVIRMENITGNHLNKLGYTTGNPYDHKSIKEVISLKPDILHAHCLTATFLTAISIRKKLNIPLVFTYHTKYDIAIKDSVNGKLFQEGLQKFFVSNINKSCDEVWAVSKGAGENLKALGYTGEYIIMPNGVDLPKKISDDNFVYELTKDYDLPNNIPMFLFVGRLYWYKGIKIILDSMSELKQQNKDFRMVFVGNGKDEQEIYDYADKLKLKDKTIFVPSVQDRNKVAAWYTRADVLLLPSTFDTNGLVVREACACFTPSVLIKDSCASENVIDGFNGFLIDENSKSLTSKLLEIMNNKELIKTVGKNASDTLYISWDDAVKKANERYDYIINKCKQLSLNE